MKEGDRALVLVSELIFASVRSIDRVARFGGDEFIIMLEENDPGEVDLVLNRINETIAVHNGIMILPYSLGVSCGYKMVYPGEPASYYDIIHRADQEMYRVKNAKKRS